MHWQWENILIRSWSINLALEQQNSLGLEAANIRKTFANTVLKQQRLNRDKVYHRTWSCPNEWVRNCRPKSRQKQNLSFVWSNTNSPNRFFVQYWKQTLAWTKRETNEKFQTKVWIYRPRSFPFSLISVRTAAPRLCCLKRNRPRSAWKICGKACDSRLIFALIEFLRRFWIAWGCLILMDLLARRDQGLLQPWKSGGTKGKGVSCGSFDSHDIRETFCALTSSQNSSNSNFLSSR